MNNIDRKNQNTNYAIVVAILISLFVCINGKTPPEDPTPINDPPIVFYG